MLNNDSTYERSEGGNQETLSRGIYAVMGFTATVAARSRQHRFCCTSIALSSSPAVLDVGTRGKRIKHGSARGYNAHSLSTSPARMDALLLFALGLHKRRNREEQSRPLPLEWGLRSRRPQQR